jgi:hypothetical protein
MLLLQKLAANKKKRNAAREAEAQQRAAIEESERRAAAANFAADELPLTPRRPARPDTTLADITDLEDKLGLGGCSSDYLDSEKILYATEPEEPTSEVDASVAAATKEALTTLGLYNTALTAYFQDEERIMASEVFRNSVISGVIASQAIKHKHCSDETAAGLFSLLAFSSDGELAGGAFRSLLCILGEDTTCTGTGLDASYGFDLNTGKNANRNDEKEERFELSVTAVPSAATILNALEKNGYLFNTNGAINPKEKDDNKGDSMEEEGEKEKEQAPETIRVYNIKLLLHTAIAVCNHCARKPEAAKNVLPSSDVCNLLMAVMYMGLDAAAVRLQPDLDAACIALLGALTDDEWSLKLPLLSKRIAEMGRNSRLGLRVLRQLPSDDVSVRNRVRQLQRYAGCILVEKILPGKLAPKSSAIPSRGLTGAPDPTDILLAQPWFRNPKAVVTGALSAPPKPTATAEEKAEAYTTFDVELLLHFCDLLLWPSALRAVKERTAAIGASSPSPVKQNSMKMITPPPPEDDEEMLDVAAEDGGEEPELSAEFLAAWSTFLTGIVRNIKTLQPEEMAVKTLASRLEFKYKETVEKPMWALSP